MASRWKSKSSGSSSNAPKLDDSKSFNLGKNIFVSISEFKGQVRVDIREYYFDDKGDLRPGKKGISLSMDEWNKIKSYLPKIEKAIKGIDDSESDNESDHKKKHNSDSDSDEKPKKSSKTQKKKAASDSEEDSDSPKKKSKKAKNLSASDSDEDSDKQKKKGKKSKDSSASDSD